MIKKIFRKILIVLLIATLLLVGYKIYINKSKRVEDVKFSRIIDGDSFYLTIKDEEVECRLIGIDAPEMSDNTLYAKEAKSYCNDLLVNANKLRVEYDEESKRVDNYGRDLVYVFIDDKLLQLELLKQGYAKVAYVYGDYKYLSEMKKAEFEARCKQLNIWNYK